MSKRWRLRATAAGLVLLLGTGLIAARVWLGRSKAMAEEADRRAVTNVVEEFGKRLQMVSLLAPTDVLASSMNEQYGQLVAPELIQEWLADPLKAPGRMTSSPWPDRIEIDRVTKKAPKTWEVEGTVVEVTSVEKQHGGAAVRRGISLGVEKVGGQWLITSVTLEAGAVAYENEQYGFAFSLPSSWDGYSVVPGSWDGYAVSGPKAGQVVERGPLITLRHPAWTNEQPRQDIPIMVFTLSQWDRLQRTEFSISAAPIGPRELGRNSGYVFALPPRYNYAFLTGFEEVERIIAGSPLLTREPAGQSSR